MKKNIPLDVFKKALQDGNTIQECTINKNLEFSASSVGNEDDRVIRFIASGTDIDRAGDTIDVNGWDLKHYNSKGLFLWAHEGANPPIGEGLKAFVEGGELKVDVKFIPDDLADHDWVKFADMIYKMYLNNIMKDVSVGFMPYEAKLAEDREKDFFYPMDFAKQELLELSAVTVGAYRGVGVEHIGQKFIDAKKSGIDINPLVKWSEKIQDTEKEGAVFEYANGIYQLVTPKKVVTPEVKEVKEDIIISTDKTKLLEDRIENLEKGFVELVLQKKELEAKFNKLTEEKTVIEETQVDTAAYAESMKKAISEAFNKQVKIPLTGKI